tara:strand:+ start:357 stop:1202 length:846 start_codon:yes stop_codon:yes gene_type:complete
VSFGFKLKFGIMQGRLSPMIQNKIQFFPKKNWKNEFKLANKLGLSFIEWTLDYKDLSKNPIFLKNDVNYIKKLCKTHSIKLRSLTGDCFMQKPFWKEKFNSKLIDDLKRIVIASKNIGIKYIIVPLVDNGRLNNKSQENKLVKICSNLKNFLKKNKVKLLFESDFEPIRLKKFIQRFDNDAFGINYDLGNSAGMGYDLNSEFKNYGKYIDNIHIKDRVLNGTTVRLGKGNANFDNLFFNLKKYKYKKILIFQTARAKNNKDVEEIKINIMFIKKYLNKFYD